jgi:Ca2+-binding RTX toxin-like protein
VLPLAVAASLALPEIVAARPRKCLGKRATITGTPAADRLVGTRGSDVIAGLGGNDVILGRTGKDRICGGAGDDFVRAGGAEDVVDGGVGNDTVAGDLQNDSVRGGAGNDVVYGGRGNDALRAGTGEASIMFGNAGNDRLTGGDGFDVLLGLEGDDTIDGGPGRFDIASFVHSDNPNGIIADLEADTATGEGEDTIPRIETLEGSRFGDQLVGDSGINIFYPRAGNDSVVGGGGNDVLSFVFSRDGVTAEMIPGSASGEGEDTFSGIRTLQGSERRDNFTGNLLDNVLNGGKANDDLSGHAGDDVLNGGTGTDTGDGGLQIQGDRCISIEEPTDCEIGDGSGGGGGSPLDNTLAEIEQTLEDLQEMISPPPAPPP